MRVTKQESLVSRWDEEMTQRPIDSEADNYSRVWTMMSADYNYISVSAAAMRRTAAAAAAVAVAAVSFTTATSIGEC